MKTRVINIPRTAEYDIQITLPTGPEILVQYRKYNGTEDTEEGASIDIILDKPRTVYNWIGSDMTPAKPVYKQKHVREADQLCFMF